MRWFLESLASAVATARVPRPMENLAVPVEEIPASRLAAISKGDQMDLKRLSDHELELLGKLLAKSAGLFEGDVDVPFRIELVRQIVDPHAADKDIAK
jgi:hypothetical protein